VALLIGPPLVRKLGLDPTALRDQFGAIVAGRPRLPGLVFPLLPGPTIGPDRLAKIMATIGPAKLRTWLGTGFLQTGSCSG
jgi:hypothetical protein